MLSILPNFLILEGFSPLILRLTLGAVFLFWGYTKFKNRKNENKLVLSIFEGIVGVLLILGFLTQIGALLAMFTLIVRVFNKIKTKNFLTDGVNYYLILLVISISILITGPGFIAFDLPL